MGKGRSKRKKNQRRQAGQIKAKNRIESTFKDRPSRGGILVIEDEPLGLPEGLFEKGEAFLVAQQEAIVENICQDAHPGIIKALKELGESTGDSSKRTVKVPKDRVRSGAMRVNFDYLQGTMKTIMPCCPKCGQNFAIPCGYLVKDEYNGDYDCEAPDINGEDCDHCHHLYCAECKAKETADAKV